MALATIDLVNPVTLGVSVVVLVFAVVIELAAFIHCLFQRRDAFNAVSTLPKGLWIALTLGGLILTVLIGISPTNPVNLFAMVGIVASAVYLLDVRPAIRDVTNGGGPW
jgi:hypothetical protein